MEVFSPLQLQIQNDLKQAMIAKNTLVRDVLRMVTSELKNRQIDNGQAPLSDEQVVEVLLRLEKQRKDSIAQYTEGGRVDLAETEEAELGVITEYLPKKLTEEELKTIVTEVVSASETNDFGSLMKQVMGRVKGQADGNVVRSMVQEMLSR